MAKLQKKSRQVNVVLLDDVPHLGQRGELKVVKPGYLRYLVQLHQVETVTTRDPAKLDLLRRSIIERATKGQVGAEVLKQKIEGLIFTGTVKTGEQGEVYSSIRKQDLIEFLKGQKITVAPNRVLLEEPIRAPGERTIEVHLGFGVVASLKVIVEAGR